MNPRKILIVDDSVIILKAFSTKLRASGYEVITAADGSDAVSTARQHKPDLIILDISFPPDVGHGGGVPWDGFLILNWLQRMKMDKTPPVIVVTGADPNQYKARALAAGAYAFFQKPVDLEELLGTIRQALGEAPNQGSQSERWRQRGPRRRRAAYTQGFEMQLLAALLQI